MRVRLAYPGSTPPRVDIQIKAGIFPSEGITVEAGKLYCIQRGAGFPAMRAVDMCMWPRLFLYRTITGGCRSGVLKLHSSELSGL
jgi:hypothetical protein